MKWNDRRSEYAIERRCEEEELRRKMKIKEINSWDIACFGAGGEENLLKEVNLNKAKELLEAVEKKIRSLEYSNLWAKEDPAPFIENIKGYYTDLKEKKKECYYIYHGSANTSQEVIFLHDKFLKRTETSWYDYDIANSRRALYRISSARRGNYDHLLLRFNQLKTKILKEIEALERY